ncbi:SAP domain-containing protein [Rhodobacteraceae bacterium D3-12]|nr:SAP domain-containing protein [Rhodobacteraceae bacterium D3-12]
MVQREEGRPAIADISNGTELKRWYWRKDELVAQARVLGLKVTGAKFTLLERIAHFLDTGRKDLPGDGAAPKATSRFDWHSEVLSEETQITDTYRNTQNVRRFFKAAVGPSFKFNIAFMEWMRSNTGKTLGDAVAAYLDIKGEQAAPGARTRIKAHNQFNQYTRDILSENPGLSIEDVRRIWARKIALPSESGRHEYHPSDLELEGP